MDKGLDSESKNIRVALLNACSDFIAQRLKTAQIALDQAVEASNDDTKSSAGDKYETTREMMQQEIERNKKMLLDAGQQGQVLKIIELNTSSQKIQLGSVVETNRGNFFMAIGVGKIQIKGVDFYAISQGSPLGLKLNGLQKGDVFDFNSNRYQILEVY